MQTLGPLYDMGKTHNSEHEAIFFRSSHKDNRHQKRVLIPMEEKWWHSQETDHESADDSGSDMNDEPLRPPPDKDFETDALSVMSVFFRLLVFGLPAIGMAWLLNDISSAFFVNPIPAAVCCWIPIALFLLVGLFSSLSTDRLRVQHSIDRLVIEDGPSSEERPLSEAAYLEYTESWHEYGHDFESGGTRRDYRYIVHGYSSEGVKWKLDLTGLVLRFGNHRRKAEEIADAIGIEFRG